MPCPNPSVWFFPNASVSPVRENVWSVGDFAVCKRFDRLDELRKHLALQGWLREKEIPVPSSFLTVDGVEGVIRPEGVYYLMSRLPGEHPSGLLNSPEQWGHRLGKALFRLHEALAAFPHPDFFPTRECVPELEQWLAPGKNLPDGAERELREVIGLLKSMEPGLPAQLIHRDPHPGNFLFRDEEWTGVLDFELVRIEPRLVDVCYFLSSALEGEKWTEPEYMDLWKCFASAFLSEYALTESEKNAFPVMMRAIPLLFVGFWKDPERRENEFRLALFLSKHRNDLLEVVR